MKTSITGTGLPYIQNISTSTGLTLYYSIVNKCEKNARDLIHEDEISARREVVDRGNFADVEILINLHKMTSPADKTAYESLLSSFYKKKVYFKLHTDAGFIKVYGATATNARFYITDVIIRPLKQNDTRDIVIIEMISLDAIDIPRI
jgi:hypothetical protein